MSRRLLADTATHDKPAPTTGTTPVIDLWARMLAAWDAGLCATAPGVSLSGGKTEAGAIAMVPAVI